MIQTIIGKKLGQTQGFLEDGKRIPLTKIDVSGLFVSQVKTLDKDGYEAVQLGFGENKKATKPVSGHAKKAGLSKTPRFFRESKVDKVDVESGSEINVEEVLSAGDIIDVTGTSKGKGYAGVVKRHHFKGGPKTHGQSDRHRAPGSIGQSTTPGRVYKGKRMAGRMGAEQVTVKNLEVIELTDGVLFVKGLVPGPISSIVEITRRGANKKHQGLYKEPTAEEEKIDESKVEEIGPAIEEQEEMRKAAEIKAEEIEKAEAAEAQITAPTEGNVSETPKEVQADSASEDVVEVIESEASAKEEKEEEKTSV